MAELVIGFTQQSESVKDFYCLQHFLTSSWSASWLTHSANILAQSALEDIPSPTFDDIDDLAGSEEELARLVTSLDQTASRYGMESSSDSVTRVSDSTRVTIFGDSDSTRITLRKMKTRLESRFSQNDSTRLESWSMTRDSSQRHFYKISEFLIDKPTSCALKEMSIFCFSDDQGWRKFSVLPV